MSIEDPKLDPEKLIDDHLAQKWHDRLGCRIRVHGVGGEIEDDWELHDICERNIEGRTIRYAAVNKVGDAETTGERKLITLVDLEALNSEDTEK